MKIAAARPQISRATSIATDAPFSLQTDGGDSESMVEMGTFAYIAKSNLSNWTTLKMLSLARSHAMRS